MKLGIMQPYLFPYLGYFQLISAVDKFVIYDDVAFIKQGWINRNNILVNNQKHTFQVPVKDISSFKLIRDTIISDKPCNWDKKLLKTISQSYSKAPFYKDVYPIIEGTLANSCGKSIAEIALQSIKNILAYLCITKDILDTSLIFNNDNLKGEQRIIDICKQVSATTYINVIGGLELYHKERFKSEGIDLHFLKPILKPYTQFTEEFVAGLSILDVLMFCEKEHVCNLMNIYELV